MNRRLATHQEIIDAKQKANLLYSAVTCHPLVRFPVYYMGEYEFDPEANQLRYAMRVNPVHLMDDFSADIDKRVKEIVLWFYQDEIEIQERN